MFVGPLGSAGFILAFTDLRQSGTAWTGVFTNMFEMVGDFAFTNDANLNGTRSAYLAVSAAPSPRDVFWTHAPKHVRKLLGNVSRKHRLLQAFCNNLFTANNLNYRKPRKRAAAEK